MENSKTKKILVPIFNRCHYGRLRPVLKAINDHPELELQIMVSMQAAYADFFSNIRHSRPVSWRVTLPWYIRARLIYLFRKISPDKFAQKNFLTRNILEDGFSIDSHIPLFFDGGSSVSMTKAVGFGLLKLADELQRLKPDFVFVRADRFEMMAVALAAAYLNIPIIHNEGGDVSGTIDESIRHAITKIAHIHLVTTEESKKRVIQMGENPENVFVVGSPAIDSAKNQKINDEKEISPDFNFEKPFLIVLFHSVTTEPVQNNILMARNILKVIEDLKMPTILLGSNIDAGSKEVGLVTKNFLAKQLPFVFFAKSLPADAFYFVLSKAGCAIGNSSSFIMEGAYFGMPAVIVGSRQQNREKGQNVKEIGFEFEEIKKAVLEALNHGRYPSDLRFGEGTASQKIAEILAKADPAIQKKFFDL